MHPSSASHSRRRALLVRASSRCYVGSVVEGRRPRRTKSPPTTAWDLFIHAQRLRLNPEWDPETVTPGERAQMCAMRLQDGEPAGLNDLTKVLDTPGGGKAYYDQITTEVKTPQSATSALQLSGVTVCYRSWKGDHRKLKRSYRQLLQLAKARAAAADGASGGPPLRRRRGGGGGLGGRLHCPGVLPRSPQRGHPAWRPREAPGAVPLRLPSDHP
jgi:hypothetical protein